MGRVPYVIQVQMRVDRHVLPMPPLLGVPLVVVVVVVVRIRRSPGGRADKGSGRRRV